MITVDHSPDGDDPRTATIRLDGVPVIIIAKGDDERESDFLQYVEHAQVVAREVARIVRSQRNG